VIVCLGGSVCYGLRSTRGWPDHLWALGRGTWTVQNWARPDLNLREVVHETRRVDWSSVTTAILQVGTEDARGSGTPPSEFVALLEQAVGTVSALAPDAEILVCTPTPIGHTEVPGYRHSSRRWVRRVSPAVAAMADAWDVGIVRLHDMPEGLLADGVFPSPDGYAWIADRVAMALGGAPLAP